MPILVTCPDCHTTLKAPDKAVGKRVKCPKCGATVNVPPSTTPAQPEEAPRALAPGAEVQRSAPPLPEEAEKKERVPPGRRAAEEEEEQERPRRRGRADGGRGEGRPARKKVNALGVVSLVVGVGALLFSWIPCLGMLSIPFSALGLLLGLIAVAVALVGKRSGLGSPIAGSVVSLAALGIALAITFWLGRMATEPVRAVAEADQLYAQGKRAEAVAIYKANFLFAPDKGQVLKRIVEEEVRQGHTEEAKRWIEKGRTAGIEVTYDSPAAQALAAAVKKEHDAQVVQGGGQEHQAPGTNTTGTQPAAPNDYDKLEGKWNVSDAQKDGGQYMGYNKAWAEGSYFTFSTKPPLKEHKCLIWSGTTGGGDDYEYTLDLRKYPKEIDLKRYSPRQEIMGIYKLEGDTLSICIHPKVRPTDFTTKKGDERILFVMKRDGGKPPATGLAGTGTPPAGPSIDRFMLQGVWTEVKGAYPPGAQLLIDFTTVAVLDKPVPAGGKDLLRAKYSVEGNQIKLSGDGGTKTWTVKDAGPKTLVITDDKGVTSEFTKE